MIRFTKHALEAKSKREIAIEWIEATVNAPDSSEPDFRHPERTRSYKAIGERGGRVLRVVHRVEGDDIVVITAHFDRRAKR
jgi:Domain of unknown function (DUF4258)